VTRVYTKSEKFYEDKLRQTKHIDGVNEIYWNDFEQNSEISISSLTQYKSAVRRFTLSIDKDILESSTEDLNVYLGQFKEWKTKNNQQRYIQSFLVYTISNNIEKAILDTSSDLILSLIPDEYRNLMKVLMSK